MKTKARITVSFDVVLQDTISIKEMELYYLPFLEASTSSRVIFDLQKAHPKVEKMELLENV